MVFQLVCPIHENRAMASFGLRRKESTPRWCGETRPSQTSSWTRAKANLFWATTYGLICGARGSGTTASGSAAAGASVCGPGWADPTIDPTPPPDYDTPSSVVHTRREPAGAGENHLMADKIVLAQSKAHRSNKTFITLAAHTGSTLFHSHSVDTGALVNLWHGVPRRTRQARHVRKPRQYRRYAAGPGHAWSVPAARCR